MLTASAVLLAVAIALTMGVVVGMLGGGGSVIMLPALVYLLGVETKSAIATSLLVVALTSIVGTVLHARHGSVAWRAGLVFGGAAMCGAFAGGRAAEFVPGTFLLIGFASMMLAVAIIMLRPQAPSSADTKREPRMVQLALIGIATGATTGLVGVGGGFLVVPALVLLGGLSMHMAVGTTLIVVTMNTLAGFAGHAAHAPVDWWLVAIFTGGAVVGSFLGAHFAHKLSQHVLRRIFAIFVLVMALLILMQELPALL